ncbi:MAG: ABC transporter ATP-binding protein [Verrucomicrobia bacterium]|nr:ABC transporter ATP-binding protein [Verrucomicrobiota bacterium]
MPHRCSTNLSFRFPAGSRVAIVSAAGYGSSTLLDLMFALRPIDQGELLVDGVDLRHWPLKALREDVALVRGTEIISGTILENVSLGRTAIGPPEVRDALEAVGLLPAILQWPAGVDTPPRGGRKAAHEHPAGPSRPGAGHGRSPPPAGARRMPRGSRQHIGRAVGSIPLRDQQPLDPDPGDLGSRPDPAL